MPASSGINFACIPGGLGRTDVHDYIWLSGVPPLAPEHENQVIILSCNSCVLDGEPLGYLQREVSFISDLRRPQRSQIPRSTSDRFSLRMEHPGWRTAWLLPNTSFE